MRLGTKRRAALLTPAPTPAVDQAPATLDLIYSEIRATLQESAAQNATLESKAGFILTAASLLITGVTGAQAAVATRHTQHILAPALSIKRVHLHVSLSFSTADAMHALICIAALIYLWVVIFAWRAYMVRKFKVISPETLYDYIDPIYTQEWQIKKMLAHAMRDQHTINQKKIDIKSRQVERALYGLLVEVIFLAIILVLLIVL